MARKPKRTDVLIRILGDLGHWFLHYTGTDNEAGGWYAFFSGFGGAIPDFLILGGLVQFYRTHTCAHRPCQRWAHHVTKDGIKLCKVHIGKPLAELDFSHIHPDHQP